MLSNVPVPGEYTTLQSFLHQLDTLRRANGPRRVGPYETAEAFLLKHGREWPWAPLPTRVNFGVAKACFHNALTLAIRRPTTVVYAEGWAMAIIPIRHAWCVDIKTGRVVEPTLRDPASEYFGVAFDLSFVHRIIWQQGYFGVLEHPAVYAEPPGSVVAVLPLLP